ncbi:MAG: hypothetical protein UW07_C0021G0012 [Candidatus Nomurabacteria bacterium GW2011_GWF2_43_8]|uniref:Uncharacterized protein n=3 Tax=Candidatus Nomuraibacteriota TaxID=1752729 RepID=A0A0G1FNX8_9BACT|nr:MAG: hypothetical protein UV76_C0008G0035 [Candidatus Nomurabacteria bacterium GW2011_GWA2_43_15]KKT19772.1 MAG: hypothetical protein UW02_C0005G0007 [Candidatus Nomurabacteria bacterium GW2011_GWB1_43_7]KKT23728.1 MAG: hypothetical protein UW07_C0021G0012 [Candidatus Nomurabacteria bacterium GW2011_GWF2_43_8]
MKKHILLSFVPVLLFGLFFSALSTEAAPKPRTLVKDDFNDYRNGDVIGQDRWFNWLNGNTYVVQDNLVREGKKALYGNNAGSESIITKMINIPLADGRQSFYVRAKGRASWGNYGSGENVRMGIFQQRWGSPSEIILAFMKDGHVAYFDPTSEEFVNFDTYDDNSWTLAEIEWRSADKTARYRIDRGAWTNWMPFAGGLSFNSFDTVGFATSYLGTGGVYIDTLR